jgi:hypothetical protein
MRIVWRIFGVFVGVYLVLLLCLAIAMRQPPDTFGAIMAKLPPFAYILLPFQPMWMSARAGHVQVGEAAPDFTLPTMDLTKKVTLSSFRGSQPVALVFGSYT